MFVYQEGIDFKRGAKPIRAVKIRQIHSCKSISTPGQNDVRNLSCYCPECIDGNYDECKCEVGGGWKRVSIKEVTTGEATDEEEDDIPEQNHISELAVIGSIVAIEDSNDFKLYSIVSESAVLESPQSDDKGLMLPAGAEVFRANLCVPEKSTKTGTYYTVEAASEFIQPEDIRYVIVSVKEKSLKRGTFKVIKASDLDNIHGIFM